MITFGFRNKFSGVARASIAIILGLIMIIWRGSILPLIVKVIAAVMIASGIVSLAYGIINKNNGALGLSVFNTVVDIVIGILLFIYPNQVADFVVILIGIALTVFGIFQVIALLHLLHCAAAAVQVIFRRIAHADIVQDHCHIFIKVIKLTVDLVKDLFLRLCKAVHEYRLGKHDIHDIFHDGYDHDTDDCRTDNLKKQTVYMKFLFHFCFILLRYSLGVSEVNLLKTRQK